MITSKMSKPTIEEILAPKPQAKPRIPSRLRTLLDRVACTAYNDCIDVTT
jgi:hypothetical protein